MAEPLVVAIMLTKDRGRFAARAVEAFRVQTYGNRRLLVYDTGQGRCWDDEAGIRCWHVSPSGTIGALRNQATMIVLREWPETEIVVHWDDDDYSHPERIAEQVALLVASGAECVGYREMLFWSAPRSFNGVAPVNGEAWIYSNPTPRNYCLGTSLCYWRSAWEKSKFADTSSGDEGTPMFGFQSKLDRLAFSSLFKNDCIEVGADKAVYSQGAEPRMIARLHGGNTASKIHPESTYWRRVPEWDDYCRKVMAL